MEKSIKPKWDLPTAIRKADEAYSLASEYRTDLESRLKVDELTKFKVQVDELAIRRPAQKENLITQKSKTLGQGEIATELREQIVSIRNLVRSNNPSDEVYKAFGIGERINNNNTSITAAANIVVLAYTNYKDWSNTEGSILEEDIDEIKDSLTLLGAAAERQDTAVKTRKGETFDKNLLQRLVEDEVTRISAMGQHAFRKKNKSIAILFENLIPNDSNGDNNHAATPPN